MPFACLALLALVSLATGWGPPARAAAQAALPDPAKVDALFARFTTATPGCAVGVGVGGRSALEKAYGMADLEHDVPLEAASIFEAGSVSKQFTAAAVLLLARDGKLSLDDPVRTHVPELPDYGTPITIRHLLNHTSGLRDWGAVAGIGGVPRGSRTYTHAHVLEILGRQRATNFPPGTRYSYSNSGYNLAAIIVSRVAGLPFAEFTKQRIFAPLGMTRTSWRDDYTRIVKDRAIAYSGPPAGPFALSMPFEHVHGNGGLLTTVGDLLRWNEQFVTGQLGGPGFVAEQLRPVPFASGAMQRYTLGLMLGRYKGLDEVSHSGSTAGYQAYLTRFPASGVSVAVLCNVASGGPTALAHAVADLYLGDRINEAAPRLPALDEARGPLARLQPDGAYRPSPADLAEFAGTYTSAEAETTLVVEVRNGALVARRRPDAVLPLRPHSRDRFEAGGGLGLVTFHRADGRVTELGVTQDRVWDLRFVRAR